MQSGQDDNRLVEGVTPQTIKMCIKQGGHKPTDTGEMMKNALPIRFTVFSIQVNVKWHEVSNCCPVEKIP